MYAQDIYGTPKRTEPQEQWMYAQSLAYPHHEQHSILIEAWRIAVRAHGESRHHFHLWAVAQGDTPRNEQSSIEEENYAEKLEQTGKELEVAKEKLLSYINHLPQERIDLYVAEIAELQPHLDAAKAAEHEYTTQLLNDPGVAKKRLERMIHGHTGLQAEYSAEQLTRLRSLRNAVEEIESKIRSCERDIAAIHELVEEAEQRAKVQAAMSEAIPAFNSACVEFIRAWKELRNIASEHEILFYDQMPEIPSGATFYQQTNPHDKQSILNLTFK